MSEILITCPSCGFNKKIKILENTLPNKPVKVMCPSCNNSFVVDKSREDKTSQNIYTKTPAPPPLSKQSQTPTPSGRSANGISNNAEESVPSIAQTKTPQKKQLEAIIAVLLLITIVLVPTRIWLSNIAMATPYPSWLAASKHGLAMLYGNEFYVVDFNGNIQWSQKLPDNTAPCQISWQGEDIWISDRENDRILKFHDRNMTPVALRGPKIGDHLNVAVSLSDHKLYITDSQNHKIKIYNEDGEYLDQFGKKGFSDGEFFFPKDIVFDDKGQLIIGNTRRAGVDVFKTDGTFVKTLMKHEGNPLKTIKNIPVKKLKDTPADSLLPQIVSDFAIDNQSLVIMECNQLVTQCKIVSYNLDGKLNKTIPHNPGMESAGDIAVWQGLLYVSNCLKRNVDIYNAATLDYQGSFSKQIDEIGITNNRKMAFYSVLSKVLLFLMVINFIPIIWLYIRLKWS